MEQLNSATSLKRSKNFSDNLGSFKIIHTENASGNIKITSEYKIVYNDFHKTNRHKSPSGVWKYFALASKDISTSTNSKDPPDDRILCMLCYSKGLVHVYKSKTSSTNLWKHLNKKHNIEIPTEKMFAISTSNFDGFEFSTDTEELSHGATSTDDQLSALEMDESDQIVIKTNDFEETDEFQEEQIIATSIEEEMQNPEAIVKYEACPTEAVFKDIGLAIIDEVAKRPILYETLLGKSPLIKAKKKMMWVEVYNALGEIIEIDRIQKIWTNIRDRYRKIRRAEKDGLDGSSQKYKYYSQLNFLDVAITMDQASDTSLDEPPEKKPRPEDYSFLIEQTEPDVMISTDDDLDRGEQNYISEEIVHDNNCTVSSSNPPNTSVVYPLEITQRESEDTITKPPTPSFGSNNSEQMDEFDLFGKLIAKKLRSVPKERVNLIEIKIMQAILENS